MKECRKCKKVLSFNNFYKHPAGKHGLNPRCKTCILEYKKIHNALPETMKKNSERNKKYRAEHTKNKEAAAHWRHRRSSRTRRRHPEAEVRYISNKDIRRLKASSCFICESSKNLQVDHLIPLALGGRHSIGNLQALCQSCNRAKFNKLPIEFKASLRG